MHWTRHVLWGLALATLAVSSYWRVGPLDVFPVRVEAKRAACDRLNDARQLLDDTSLTRAAALVGRAEEEWCWIRKRGPWTTCVRRMSGGSP